jgi:hypothetical protein
MIDYAGKAGKIRKIRINQDKSGKFGNNQIKSGKIRLNQESKG